MNIKLAAGVLASATLVVLATACGNQVVGKASPTSSSEPTRYSITLTATAPPLPPPPAPVVLDEQGKFGDTLTYQSGIEVTVAQPTEYKASNTAAGDRGARAVQIEITIKNGSTKPLDLNMSHVQATHDGVEAGSIFDSAKGMGGMPSTTVLPGRTAKAKLAFSLASPNPGELQVEVTPSFIDSETVFFVGQV